MKLPPLNALKHFEAVARLGSIIEASDELCVTQGAVSQQIKILESFIGSYLFDRVSGKLILTEFGTEYFNIVTKSLRNIEESTNRITNVKQNKTWIISTTPSFNVKWLIPNLKNFQKLCPDLIIQIQPTPKPINFEIDRVDVAVRFTIKKYDNILMEYLINPTMIVVASPNYVTKYGRLTKLEKISGHNLIHCKPPSIQHANLHLDWDDVIYSTFSDKVKKHLIFPEDHMVLTAALHGYGLALVEKIFVSNELKSGELVQASDITFQGKGNYYLVWPKDAEHSTIRDKFMAWLKEDLIRDNIIDI